MAGAKTRFGFAGDGPEPPDSDQARGARTVIGRDLHLQQPGQASNPDWPAGPFAAVRAAPTPVPLASKPMARAVVQAAVQAVGQDELPEELSNEATAELPSRQARPRQGHSRLARFLGRWTKSGRFVSESRVPARNRRDEDLEVPRDPLGRNVVLVLVVASVTFLLTLVAVKARQHFTDKPPAAASPAIRR
jgi:hypothetical protein